MQIILNGDGETEAQKAHSHLGSWAKELACKEQFFAFVVLWGEERRREERGRFSSPKLDVTAWLRARDWFLFASLRATLE
jgi:hypothetical protein